MLVNVVTNSSSQLFMLDPKVFKIWLVTLRVTSVAAISLGRMVAYIKNKEGWVIGSNSSWWNCSKIWRWAYTKSLLRGPSSSSWWMNSSAHDGFNISGSSQMVSLALAMLWGLPSYLMYRFWDGGLPDLNSCHWGRLLALPLVSLKINKYGLPLFGGLKFPCLLLHPLI